LFFVLVLAFEFVAAAGTVVLVANARSAIVAAVFFRVAEAAVASRAHALREVDAHLFVHASKSPASEFLAALALVVTFPPAGIAIHVGGAVRRVVCVVVVRWAVVAVFGAVCARVAAVFVYMPPVFIIAFAFVVVVFDLVLEALHAALALLVIACH